MTTPATPGALFRNINGLKLRVWGGDLFEAYTDAIVNSEQTDFQLSLAEGTISNQVLQRIGESIQDELIREVAAALTGRDPEEPIARDPNTDIPVLDPGTVLKTSGGPSFKAIYHAGFHHPHVWLDETDELNATSHVAVIQRCIRTILTDFAASDLQSLALPLLGTGVFGLDLEFIYVQTVETITDFAFRHPMPGKTVVIVRRLPPAFSAFLESVQAPMASPTHVGEAATELLDYEPPAKEEIHYGGVQEYRLDPDIMRGAFFELEVPFLDGFATQHILSANDETWRIWNTVRFGELLNNLMLHKLAGDQGIQPRNLFKPHTQVTFDLVRKTALSEAHTDQARDDWGAFFAGQLRAHAGENGAFSELNEIRNAIAHGRKPPTFDRVYHLLWEVVDPVEWKNLVEKAGPLDLYALYPWEYQLSDTQFGLFERWNAKYTLYLDPVAGVDFERRTPR